MPDEGTAIGQLFQSLQAEQYRISAIMAGLQKDVAGVQVDVAKQNVILKEGNGGHSFIVRLAIIEQRLKDMEARETDGRHGRWDLTKTVLSAALAVVSSLAVALLLR